MLLGVMGNAHSNGLWQAHEREGQSVQEHSQIVEDAVRTREPEAWLKLKTEVHDTIKEENDETDYESC